MRRWTFGTASVLAALCALATAAHGANVYKWVDADGVVHYGGSPPPGGSATVVETRRSHITHQEAKARLEALTGRARGGAPRDEHARADGQPAADHAARRRQNCEIATENLRILEGSAPVEAQGPDGQPFYLDEEAKQAKLGETRAQIAEFCG